MAQGGLNIGSNLAAQGRRSGGVNLTNFGAEEQADATRALGQAATEETQRNIKNKEAKAAAKQGNMALAGTIGGLAGGAYAGATWGSAAGPWGTLIGGVVGALAGSMMN